jgi:hypothetical protein
MGILKISPHKTFTLSWWYMNRDMIDFNPPYQRRGRLWSVNDKAFLIDSILNGFDVPKLYFADFQYGASALNTSRQPYAIIDGKQRLEAVFDFFENKIVLADNFKHRGNPSLKLAGFSLKDLKSSFPRIAQEFENYSFDIMSVFADDEKDIHEIFVRLNRSKPLTGAEVRNAMAGPVPELVRTLSTHDFFNENIRFSVQRGSDLNTAAKLLAFEFAETPVATKKSVLDDFATNKNYEDKLELAIRRVIDTLDACTDVFIPRDPLLSSSGIVPVYYWFIRNADISLRPFTRRFLVWFEDVRAHNRDQQRAGADPSNESQELSRFDTLNRSTNDLLSHTGRIEILEHFFNKWLLERPEEIF